MLRVDPAKDQTSTKWDTMAGRRGLGHVARRWGSMVSEHAATWTSRAPVNESGSGAVDGEALLGKEPVGPGVRELAACDRCDVVRLGGGF
jgi:hypothetical protein